MKLTIKIILILFFTLFINNISYSNNYFCLRTNYNNRVITISLKKNDNYKNNIKEYDVHVYLNKDNDNYYYENEGICTELNNIIKCSMDDDGGTFSLNKQTSNIYLINANFVSGSHWIYKEEKFVHDDIVFNIKKLKLSYLRNECAVVE